MSSGLICSIFRRGERKIDNAAAGREKKREELKDVWRREKGEAEKERDGEKGNLSEGK